MKDFIYGKKVNNMAMGDAVPAIQEVETKLATSREQIASVEEVVKATPSKLDDTLLGVYEAAMKGAFVVLNGAVATINALTSKIEKAVKG